MGCIWAVGNFTAVPAFSESGIFLDLASSLATDGFHLIGYVLLTALFSKAVPALYLVQFLLVLSLVYKGSAAFLRASLGTKIPQKNVWMLTLLIMTNPFLWQLLFAILPDALAFGLGFYATAYMFLFFRKRKEEKQEIFFAASLFALTILGFIQWKGFWITVTTCGGLLIGTWFSTLWKVTKQAKRFWHSTLRIVILGICVSGVLFINAELKKMTYQEGYMPYSLSADAMKRFVYPNLDRDYPVYTEEFKTGISEEFILEAERSGEEEAYYKVLGSGMEQCFGAEKTASLCRMMDRTSLLSDTKQLIKGALKEGFAGVFAPFVLSREKYPFGDSVTPYNLNVLWEKQTVMSDLYVSAGRIGYPLCIGILLLGGIICNVEEGKRRLAANLKNSLFYILVIIQTVFGAICLSIPEFDYRNVLLPMALCAVWGTSLIQNHEDEILCLIGKAAKWEKQL